MHNIKFLSEKMKKCSKTTLVKRMDQDIWPKEGGNCEWLEMRHKNVDREF